MCDARMHTLSELLARQGEGAHVGILGGTFDPIHFGHLACAEFAMDSAELDAILFIPAGKPTFKQGVEIASVEDRLAMTELAVFDNDRFSVSSVEAERDGITHTIDTVRELSSAAPAGMTFSFILGADAFMLLEGWKEFDELVRMVDFICVSRPGYALEPMLERRLRDRGVRMRFVEAPLLDISATEIRERLADRRSIRYLTPLAVCDYIRAKGLYQGSERISC